MQKSKLSTGENKQRRGRPSGRSKAVISISLDKDIIAALRKSGSGWQTRVNALLKHVVAFNKNGKD